MNYIEQENRFISTFYRLYCVLVCARAALVEPWVFKKDFRKGTVAIDVCEDGKTKLARMSTSRLTKAHWLVYFHYLTGINGKIEHKQEIHKMIAADYEDYVKGFNLAGYREIKFLGENEWTRTRGLFVATK